MKHLFSYIISLLVFTTCPVSGQVSSEGQQQLVNDKINPSGSAVTFFSLEDNRRTLVLKNLKSGNIACFDNVDGGTVLTDHALYIKDSSKNLIRFSLTDNLRDTVKQVNTFYYNGAYSMLYVYSSKKQLLELRKADNLKLVASYQVMKYSLSDDFRQVLLHDIAGTYRLLDLKNLKRNVVWVPENPIRAWDKVVWENNKAFIIFKDDKEIRLQELGIKGIESEQLCKLPLDENQWQIDASLNGLRRLSDSLWIVGLRQVNVQSDTVKPQVWKQSDVRIISKEKKHLKGLHPGILTRGASTIRVLPYGDHTVQYYTIGNNLKLYLVTEGSNDVKISADRNISVYDLATGSVTDAVVFSGNKERLLSSAHFNDLLYFKDRNWHLYNTDTDKYTDVTTGARAAFYEEGSEFCTQEDCSPVTKTFNVTAGAEVFLNDSYDVWKLNVPQKKLQKLTSGRAKGLVYSLDSSNGSVKYLPWSMSSERIVKKEAKLLYHYHLEDYSLEGIALEGGKGVVVNLIQDDASYSQINRSGNFITYIKQRANIPPVVCMFDTKERKEIVLYCSNAADTLAALAKTKYLQWLNTDGEKRGVLIRYPLDYDQGKKYPAIVDIYEKKYKGQHKYTSNKVVSSIGFNWRNYTEEGYFVLEPDIYYKIGETGDAAKRSVEEALDKVVESISLDQDRIALIGHSFGGYETNFIITGSNRFRAAVSGASLSDLVSGYHFLNKASYRPEFWRYEQYSLRMGKPFFEIPEIYLKNSPLHHAQKISTPLLLWAGTKDAQIDYQQSLSFFLALKRQQKKVTMLLYEDEHVLFDRENKYDLKYRLKQYFDFHLKDSAKPDWLE
ncbi:MAG: prolyl oligopeptidase family serine peptidase [Pedobacter sp.]|uniref:alpha/beta hydrolase family protein n=1 Tax=Pedobacter sp. TaxID=1411316 RepID=UPI0035629BC9